MDFNVAVEMYNEIKLWKWYDNVHCFVQEYNKIQYRTIKSIIRGIRYYKFGGYDVL